MHEMSVASGIIKVLGAKLKEQGQCRLLAMVLAVGELSGIEEQSLRFALETLLAEQGFASVELRFEQVPAAFKCSACGWRGRPDKFTAVCPACGKGELEIIAGREVSLERIEIE